MGLVSELSLANHSDSGSFLECMHLSAKMEAIEDFGRWKDTRHLLLTFPELFCFSQFSSVQSLNCVRLFVTPWTAACQAYLSITNSRSLPKLMSVESVMPSNHLILYCPLLLLPSIFPSIRVFSNESVLHIRWPKYWSFSFCISLSSEYSGLISFRIIQDWFPLGWTGWISL